MSFSLRVGDYRKHQYQEGNENDCKFLCKDGVLFGGCTVLSFASRFMEMAIIKEREKQTGEEVKLRKTVELDFKMYATKTIKTWLDVVYGVNVDPIPPKVGLQIIQFLSQLGHYQLPDGKDDYECTTGMIDAIAENIKTNIGKISKSEKVDLAMASMIIPVPPSVMLANELMTGISEADIVQACYDLVLKTDHFEIYIEDDAEEIKKTNFAIEIISDYLKGLAGKEGVTGKYFRKKFNEIQTQLRKASNYCPCGQTCEIDFAKASCKRSIKSGIQPPKDAKEIFMGGGIIGSDVVKIGVFGTIEELFDQREYPRNQDTDAKSVRKYYAYYDSGTYQSIGFSKRPTIHLHSVANGAIDISNRDDETTLWSVTTGAMFKLYRCGSSNFLDQTGFEDTFQIVFYYRT